MIKQKGFTLMELMIVIAIVGIVSAVAYPIVAGKSPQNLNTETGCANNG